jgi:molecular chaperone Hsp33
MNSSDSLRRFLFEDLGVRGEWVRLESSWQEAKQHQQANSCALEQLGQAMAAAVLLSATVKFEGSLILQAQGKGALKTVVAQATHDKHIRGLVRGAMDVQAGTLTDMYGDGLLVLTIESGRGEPYQGVVALQGNNFAEALQTYFNQSEQLPTRLWLFANETYAAGLFLQELPGETGQADAWNRLEILANTITAEEIYTLSCEDLLYRLFNQEEVTLFDSETVKFECNCSFQKIERTLFSLGRQELEEILAEQDGKITVNCEFCSHLYEYDAVDVEKLLAEGSTFIEKLH